MPSASVHVCVVVSAQRFWSPRGPGGRSADIISVFDHRRDSPPPGAAITHADVRFAFPPSSTADDALDGGWWPRTRDPHTELPALVAAVADRLGVVHRIKLNADDWTSWPHQLVIIGGPAVRLNWCTGDAHTVRLTGRNASHLDLLAIPPDTPAVLALTCLARVAGETSHLVGPGDTASMPRPLRGPADNAGSSRRPAAGSTRLSAVPASISPDEGRRENRQPQ